MRPPAVTHSTTRWTAWPTTTGWRAAWRAAEKQVEDLGNQVKEGRAQIDALRVANVNLEKVATERQIALNKANLHITELEARLADTADLLKGDIAAGAPTNANGTLNLVHYAAWLVQEMSRSAEERHAD